MDKLAGLADKISEQYLSTSMSIAEVSPKINLSQESGDVSIKLDTIIARIDALERHSRRDRRNNSVERTRSNSRNRKETGMCWYHWRFAEKATKCLKPCNYKSPKN